MSKIDTSSDVGAELLAGWLAARSIARGLPLPVPERGGLRVDTGSAIEVRRYVFAGPSPEIRELAMSITTPRIFIKMLGSAERLLELVAPMWQLQPGAYVMIHDGRADARPALSLGYRLELATEGGAVCDPADGCSYGHTVAFRSPTQPLPMEFNPRKIFYRLFGQGDTSDERARITDDGEADEDVAERQLGDARRRRTQLRRRLLEPHRRQSLRIR